MGGNIDRLADACRNRAFPAALTGGRIQHEHHSFDPGQSEFALIERLLRGVEARENLLVHNRFSTPMAVAMLCHSYMFWASPKIPGPSKDKKQPLLLLPASTGYLGELENFHHTRQINGSLPFDRHVISSTDELQSSNDIYSAKSADVIRGTIDGQIGLLFVDFRDNTWQNSLSEIADFCEQNSVRSLVLYTDGSDSVAELGENLVDDRLELSGTALADATVESRGSNPTAVREQEWIISDGADATVRGVGGQSSEQLRKLYGAKKRVKRHTEVPEHVERLHELLLRTPVPPRIYDEEASGDGYYWTTGICFSRIEDSIKARKRSGNEQEVQVLEAFRDQALRTRAALNESNPRFDALLEIIEEAQDSTTETILVANNRMEQNALKTALFQEIGDLLDDIPIVKRNQLEPDATAHIVFASTPSAEGGFLEFPPSMDVTYLTYFPEWLDERLQEHGPTTLHVNVQNDSAATPSAGTMADDSTLENLEDRISLSLPDPSETADNGGDGEDRNQDYVDVRFTDGSIRTVPATHRMTVYDGGEDEINQLPAIGLAKGQQVLLVQDAVTDIFQSVVERKHDKEKVSNKKKDISGWRDYLNGEISEREHTPESFLQEMQDRGSTLSSTQTLENWLSGETIGPKRLDDVRISLAIVDEKYESHAERVFESLKYIRTLHRQIGREIRKGIHAELDPTKSPNEEIDPDISGIIGDAELKRVEDVTSQVEADA